MKVIERLTAAEIQLRAPPGSKITPGVLGWVEDSVVRSDSRDFGVAESFLQCAFVWIVW
jgi:hypothetical protein